MLMLLLIKFQFQKKKNSDITTKQYNKLPTICTYFIKRFHNTEIDKNVIKFNEIRGMILKSKTLNSVKKKFKNL